MYVFPGSMSIFLVYSAPLGLRPVWLLSHDCFSAVVFFFQSTERKLFSSDQQQEQAKHRGSDTMRNRKMDRNAWMKKRTGLEGCWKRIKWQERWRAAEESNQNDRNGCIKGERKLQEIERDEVGVVEEGREAEWGREGVIAVLLDHKFPKESYDWQSHAAGLCVHTSHCTAADTHTHSLRHTHPPVYAFKHTHAQSTRVH